KRQEKMRLQPADRAAARRRRVRERLRARRERVRTGRPPFRARFRQWRCRPSRARGTLLLCAGPWVTGWAAFAGFGLGDAEAGAAARTGAVTWAVLLMQGATGALALGDIRGLAREGLQWSGPPGAGLPPARVWGGGLAVAALAYGLGRG